MKKGDKVLNTSVNIEFIIDDIIDGLFYDSDGSWSYPSECQPLETKTPAEVNKLSFSECKPTVPNTDESYNKPKRYSTREINGMDVIDIAEHFKLNPQEFNILKYLLRDKGQDYDDMLKISDYALRESKLIKQRENK
tara:strand:- start:67 stop:477 length:411 start_codon:yes stop_codon:yes gene_type:complete